MSHISCRCKLLFVTRTCHAGPRKHQTYFLSPCKLLFVTGTSYAEEGMSHISRRCKLLFATCHASTVIYTSLLQLSKTSIHLLELQLNAGCAALEINESLSTLNISPSPFDLSKDSSSGLTYLTIQTRMNNTLWVKHSKRQRWAG